MNASDIGNTFEYVNKFNGSRPGSSPSINGCQAILFSVHDKAGGLAIALKIFKDAGINLVHIESRPSRRYGDRYEFFVLASKPCGSIKDALEHLKNSGADPMIMNLSNPPEAMNGVPWFPRSLTDLDQFANQILSYGAELESNHPGFTDPVYRARRKECADIAYNYRQ
ncbi:putative Tyrosine/tryptophan monooxygenase [Fasciola gigantica]|uniref:phenylalanine 4-monooxygenase n=1 Tax=Fasciola gigantica TaxID=46835 RepID=A0A504YWC4_FASGI|nr:putative Tyrosine/tryptophan monooxygenase [Fasciola gigantica]